MGKILEALRTGRVLLMDGAMGTELARRGFPLQDCLVALNLTHPKVVADVHRAYMAAGAEVLLTNTFQANRSALAQHGRADSLREILGNGARLALGAATSAQIVLGDVGPSHSPTTTSDRVDSYSALHEHLRPVDGWLFETCSDVDDLAAYVAWREQQAVPPSEPVLCSFTYARDRHGALRTHCGLTPEECARRVDGLAQGLGVNCGRDIRMSDLLEIVERYRAVADVPLFVRPNAGTPRQVGDHWVYPETPESMASWLPKLFDAGVIMIGGCCGTTPAHIAAFRQVVRVWNASRGAEA